MKNRKMVEMKKLVSGILIFISLFCINAFASNGNGIKDKVVSKIETNTNLQLVVEHIDSLRTISIDVSGDINGWATLALTNSKGEEVYFKLIEDSHMPVKFMVSTQGLKPGFYFVQLDWEQEIRILKIRID